VPTQYRCGVDESWYKKGGLRAFWDWDLGNIAARAQATAGEGGLYTGTARRDEREGEGRGVR
jgi:hypothetical protein